jgi:hypothetical protein
MKAASVSKILGSSVVAGRIGFNFEELEKF